jgi:hypothetical protein
MACVMDTNMDAQSNSVDNFTSAIETEKRKQLVTLIANIIVDKIINYASEKGYQVPKVQPRQTKLS